MSNPNDDTLDAVLRHQIAVRRYLMGLVRRMMSSLRRLDSRTVGVIATRLAEGASQRALIAEVRRLRQPVLDELEKEFEAEMLEFAEEEEETEAGILLLPVPGLFGSVLKEPFSAGTNSARTLSQWWKQVKDADALRIRDAIQLGFAQGDTAKQIVDRLKGLKEFAFANGVLGLGRRHLEVLIRTVVSHVSTAARITLWLTNRDQFLGWMWISVLDNRTSIICQTRDGDIALAPGQQLPEGYKLLEPQGARPPAHPNCRSTMIALKRGPLPQRVNYEEWLQRQPESFQDEVLGASRAQLFREGRVSLDHFVDHSGRTLTLKELRDGIQI